MNLFKNIKSPKVLSEIDVYDFLDRVKKPNQEVKQKIISARKVHSINKEIYNQIKEQLPCFTLNFDFNETKRDSNIKSSTGFIYIDIDGTTDIDLSNQYIFASWLSLSATGRGVLVKVEVLTLENFKDCYSIISDLLNVKSDSGAKKASQYCVNSYDENIYINDNSTTYKCIERKAESPITSLIQKKEKEISNAMGVKRKLRFNNIADYDFKNKDFLIFLDEKTIISEVSLPSIVNVGKRESYLSITAHQIKALNKEITEEELFHFIYSVNKKYCFPPLLDNEIKKIICNKMNLCDILPIANKERRILFNPEKNLSRGEIYYYTNQTVGRIKVKKSKDIIKNCVENWEFDTLGKITQKKLIEKSGLCKNTIEKYYKYFKEDIAKKNTLYLC